MTEVLIMEEEQETEKEEPDFLTPEQLKAYVKVITDISHTVVVRLLVNGVSMKEMVKLRGRDIKYLKDKIKLKRPPRLITVDHPTINIITTFMGQIRLSPKSTEKLIPFKERNIRTFVNDYGKVAGISFPVHPTTLFNTFFAIKMSLMPEMTIEEYHRHLGYADMDYTKKMYAYFKKKMKL